MTPIKTGHLCCGGGGDILGAIMAGCQPVWACDIERVCTSTVIANFGLKLMVQVADIRGIPQDHFDKVDLIICGIPCQPFTRIGRRKKEKDERDISIHIAHMVRKFRPQFLLFENVREYYGTEGFRILNAILSHDYRLTWNSINFADYGIPQRRHRLIGLGAIAATPIFPRPTHTESQQLFNNLKPHRQFGEIRDGDRMLPLTVTALRGLLRRYGNHRRRGNGFSVQIVGDKDVMVTVLGTMYRGSGTSSHCNLVWEDGRIRNISITEARRAQGFPDDYIFVGTLREQWQMIANAISPMMAKILIDALLNEKKEGEEEEE